ncbi:hypothetical protein BM613_06710 [Sulfoacidibacillus thermotolerans]|uniref:Uncharacterized protein n=1 Tax=Sulfoacidibacillus thermotolerans TaxID=1765684 RepID=A0A2U3D9B4_SULT2|nr:hypothetical protein BM613_06710 [Sulfoacidibacillus thermotolerans]
MQLYRKSFPVWLWTCLYTFPAIAISFLFEMGQVKESFGYKILYVTRMIPDLIAGTREINFATIAAVVGT